MFQMLRDLRKKVAIGFVGGSDFAKISEQLSVQGSNSEQICRPQTNVDRLANLCAVLDEFDYAFAENGLTAYKMGKPLESQSFIKHIGEDQYKVLVNFILHYIADMDIPIKRRATLFSLHDFKYLGDFSGTFVEFRNGMINVSPIGRNATYVLPVRAVSTAIYGI
jgi:phosphomannomutase